MATYFGYTAKGGPVGVGRNTAQSMLVNLVLVCIIGMVLVQLFYGNDPNAPDRQLIDTRATRHGRIDDH